MGGVDRPTGWHAPSDHEPDPDQLTDDAAGEASAVRGLAQLVTDVDDLPEALSRVAGLTVEAIPGADGASVSAVHPSGDGFTVVARSATADFVREVDRLQYDVHQDGPSLTVLRTGYPSTTGALGTDARWPTLGADVIALGVHSAMSFPLVVQGGVVGAVSMYAHQRDAFGERAERVGDRFAPIAAASVHNLLTLHAATSQVAQLRAALSSRAIIDQAIGIIRGRSGADADEAFGRLRAISQAENVKLAVIAQRLVDEAVRRARAR